MTDRRVRVEVSGRVLVITMTRADKRNAIDRTMADALDAAFNRLEDDPHLWAGVLAAEGPVFSAGSDLTALGDYVTERGGEYGLVRRRRSTPLIAAVDGPALGGGFELVLACDLVVAAPGATFGLPEVGIGLVPTCGGLFRAPRQVAPNVARELVLTGDPITASRAYELGLVNRLVEAAGAGAGGAVRTAVELAQRICRNSPSAVRACLAAMDAASGGDTDGWSASDAARDTVLASDDAREGVEAFFAKRAPRWSDS